MFSSKIIKSVVVVSFIIFAGSQAVAETPDVKTALALPDAKPGECYAKVMIPAEYKTETQEIVKKDAYEQIEIIPAKYETVTEKVLVKEASEKLVPVPAVYEDLEEVIEVSASRQIWRTGRSHKSSLADPSLVAGATALGLPASAQVGQCFIEYHEHPQYKKEEKKVMIRDVSHKIEIIPAKYETVEEKVLVKQASEQLKEIAPVYETVTEKVLVKPAYTTWKKGRGLIERIDNTTGEIMCLVEVPAEYKTITKRVLKTPATTEKTEIPAEYKIQKVSKLISPAQEKKVEIPAVYETVTLNVKVSDAKTGWLLEGTTGAGEPTGNTLCLHEIPAKYETVVKKVLKSPATVEKVTIPAEYKTQQVLKLVSPSQEKRIKVPAQMQTVTKKVKVSEPKLEWRSVLCETNMTADLNMQIQQALKNAGFDPGPIDGKLGLQTMQAVDAYQVAKQLPRGGLTMKTLTSLGVRVNQ